MAKPPGSGPSLRADQAPTATAGVNQASTQRRRPVPLVYFDASAFAKLLTTEARNSLARGLWDGCDAAFSSRLAYLEVRAALAAAARITA